jgi:hypothetical protein
VARALDLAGITNTVVKTAGTSMISKSQEETEVSERLEEKALEAEMRRLGRVAHPSFFEGWDSTNASIM